MAARQSQEASNITFETTDMIGIDKLECRLDGQAFSSCMNPATYEKLRRGLHEFTSIATDEAGNMEKTSLPDSEKVTLRLKSKKEIHIH